MKEKVFSRCLFYSIHKQHRTTIDEHRAIGKKRLFCVYTHNFTDFTTCRMHIVIEWDVRCCWKCRKMLSHLLPSYEWKMKVENRHSKVPSDMGDLNFSILMICLSIIVKAKNFHNFLFKFVQKNIFYASLNFLHSSVVFLLRLKCDFKQFFVHFDKNSESVQEFLENFFFIRWF